MLLRIGRKVISDLMINTVNLWGTKEYAKAYSG